MRRKFATLMLLLGLMAVTWNPSPAQISSDVGGYTSPPNSGRGWSNSLDDETTETYLQLLKQDGRKKTRTTPSRAHTPKSQPLKAVEQPAVVEETPAEASTMSRATLITLGAATGGIVLVGTGLWLLMRWLRRRQKRPVPHAALILGMPAGLSRNASEQKTTREKPSRRAA